MDVFFLLRKYKNELKASFSPPTLRKVDLNYDNVAHKQLFVDFLSSILGVSLKGAVKKGPFVWPFQFDLRELRLDGSIAQTEGDTLK